MSLIQNTDLKPHTNLYDGLEQQCLQLFETSQNHVIENQQLFIFSTQQIRSEVEQFKKIVGEVTLLSLILLWAKKVLEGQVLSIRYLELMREMIKAELIPVLYDQGLLTLKEFSQLKQEAVIDKIRTYSDWYIQKREDSVSLYISFEKWLSEETLGLVKPVIDQDRLNTSKRKLPYEKYIEILALLPLRERLIAKLFYLGGARSLEEILNLKINQISFSERKIEFSDQVIDYPFHVFDDIKTLLEGRMKGFVFANLQKTDRIHHTVPYRTIKKAAQKIGLPASFSYKDLVSDS